MIITSEQTNKQTNANFETAYSMHLMDLFSATKPNKRNLALILCMLYVRLVTGIWQSIADTCCSVKRLHY
jgi:hypothetical protein